MLTKCKLWVILCISIGKMPAADMVMVLDDNILKAKHFDLSLRKVVHRHALVFHSSIPANNACISRHNGNTKNFTTEQGNTVVLSQKISDTCAELVYNRFIRKNDTVSQCVNFELASFK